MAKRILFVDDEDLSVEPYFSKLRDHGVEVDLARDCDQAIKLMQERQYDLMVLDIMMPPGEIIGPHVEPRKSGEVFLQRLRRNEIPNLKTPTDVPVIVLTAVTDQKLPETMKELEVKEVFQKPAAFDLVTDCILATVLADKSWTSLTFIFDLNHLSVYETANGVEFKCVDKVERNMQSPLPSLEKLTNLMKSAYTSNKPQSMQNEKLIDNDRYLVEATAAIPFRTNGARKLLIIVKQIEMNKADMAKNYVFNSYELQRYVTVVDKFVRVDEQQAQIAMNKKQINLNKKQINLSRWAIIAGGLFAFLQGLESFMSIMGGSLWEIAQALVAIGLLVFFVRVIIRLSNKDKDESSSKS